MSGAGRYEVLDVLGSGGFGTVYRARFRGEGGFTKEVALKALNPQLAEVDDIAARLRDEARVLGLLRHRAIVAVDRLVRVDGRWIVVMEYVEGMDLGQVLKAGPVPLAPALEIVAEVAGALHAAWHRPGEDGRPLHLMHRDIKPSNIQLTPLGEVKLLDFGIARADFEGREGDTRSNFFGTIEYMSPERLEMSGNTPSGDVYALASVLFEALTGKSFGRTTAHPIKHTERLAVRIAELRAWPEMDPEAVDLIEAGMAADPEARPSAAAFEQAAHALRLKRGGEMLRYWTERTLVPLLAARKQRPPPAAPKDPLISTFLVVTETGDAPSTPPSAPPPPLPKTSMALLAAAGAAAALTLLLGGAAGAWLLLNRAPAGAEPSAAPPVVGANTPPEPAKTTPAPAPPVTAPEPAPPAPEVSAVQKSAPRESAPREAKEKSSPAPTASGPGPAKVRVEGDATAVELQSDAGTFSVPGEVPAGEYRIWATFSGVGRVGAGKLSVAEGASVSLRCQSGFNKCAQR